MLRRLALIPALVAAPAWAEDPPILVTATRDAGDGVQVAQVRSLDEVRSSAASGRIEDVLANVAGLQQFRRSDSRSANPTAQGITLRSLGGNASSRTVVLLDGVPMADPFFGSVPLSALVPERLGRIEVTRGGGAGPFEAGAVAGTLELTSASRDEAGLLSASAFVDDRGSSELSASLAPRLGGGHAVLSARWDRGPGFWTTPAAQRVPASVRARYDSWSTALRAVAPLAPDAELQFRALVYEDHRTLRFAGADSSMSGQDASVRLLLRGDWQVDALAYVQARDFSNVVISAITFRKALDQYATPATGLGTKLELRPPLGAGHDLRFGLDWRHGSGETMEEAFNASTGALIARRRAGGSQGNLGLFLRHEFAAGPVTLGAGARADRWSQSPGRFTDVVTACGTLGSLAERSGWDGSLRGSARVRLGSGVTVRGAAYSAMRLPTLNELYRSFIVNAVATCPNASLANEQLRGFEGGVDWAPSRNFSLGVTAFDNRVNKAIANVTIGNNLRERRNVDAVRARGIEAQATGWIGQFHLRGSLAWTDAEMVGSGLSATLDGKRPAQTPRLAASLKLGWNPAPDWQFALMLRHTGAQFEDDLESDALPAATTISAYAEVPLAKGFALVLRGENLTDEQVVTRNQSGSIDLGTPRTVWAGVRVSLP
ncbi:TonB-dependent receptor [Novosphingobium sp. TH158]|uniref:TonB-dependent receptor n=1 Tax=Novosphingobium sp. TH158 TaxID=2067455 RepID=UPI000C7CAA43|nr:TonB-dependent receptor [Novosphingobium sp. TH158]PLK27667.1 TonB-dependent receptor [Novosphingobium sp. TH158]